nr:class I tRNA ligase family protein [Mycoplasmopsis bovis]
MDVIDKTYAPQNFEKAISKKWIDKKFFSQHDLAKKPFSLLLPPPNVTGVLHIGHALDQYIQDTILRYKKLGRLRHILYCWNGSCWHRHSK